MTRALDPETIDLSQLAEALREASGATLIGAVVGRTRLRDEVVRHLGCSQLEGETLVDTMISRGFIRREVARDGQIEWIIDSASPV
jgi:predicted DNA-binding transcriptional regulator